ncbi:MAG: hypothetical protein BGO88_08635 [Flavobacterium sp. 38-13]|uniref:hypothetical protein n=1 Tax=Flavobacterium sp. 38-13 TaxID=1896168 RepID=UPI000969FF27|nr:hypothetical protein [Flavobacterium sp. 38-13]OJX49808.1 MAG: hypothetical protein BGO88_08635 [Flavobacterium sp. 38-13]
MQNRFSDQNKTLSHFYDEVWVVCPACAKKAVAKASLENKSARLYCSNCGYIKEASMETSVGGQRGILRWAAHNYFNAELWLQHPFKNDVFFAYNGEHLNYLQQYISATLREHKDRAHFTLLEKLPKFYHEAKNRKALLTIIKKLANSV